MTESPKAKAKARPSLMDTLLGLLRIRVKRGVNLAVRDVRSSDPYVVVKMGKQVSPLFEFLFSFSYCLWNYDFLKRDHGQMIRNSGLHEFTISQTKNN